MQEELKRKVDKIYKEISTAKSQCITLIYPSESYNRKKGYELWVEEYEEDVLVIQCDFESTYVIRYGMLEIKMYSFDIVLKFLHIVISEGKIM